MWGRWLSLIDTYRMSLKHLFFVTTGALKSKVSYLASVQHFKHEHQWSHWLYTPGRHYLSGDSLKAVPKGQGAFYPCLLNLQILLRKTPSVWDFAFIALPSLLPSTQGHLLIGGRGVGASMVILLSIFPFILSTVQTSFYTMELKGRLKVTLVFPSSQSPS